MGKTNEGKPLKTADRLWAIHGNHRESSSQEHAMLDRTLPEQMTNLEDTDVWPAVMHRSVDPKEDHWTAARCQ